MVKQIEPGDMVLYCNRPSNGKTKYEKGRVKSMCDDKKHCFVVFHCNNNWSNYKNYTAQRTLISSLIKEGSDKDLLSINEYKKLNREI